ncbi:Sodium:neurotransmitter symporter family protein [Oesophagostomum dentatum]|uniref:Sodium:neurotransmitter symporter family protein n=1 Tax=Oesophagostomum dentatum TaxID=61180 RepID=A0A0B1SP92_OESDE|nr:Sodium:neurotransmitter symporter family protein [Oesophagostomum dentatum]
MDNRIIKLRELVSTDANYAAQFYLECVCHADETERILNRSVRRTSSRDNKRRRKPKGLREAVSTLSVPTIRSVPSTTGIVEVILPQRSVSEPQPRWWERFSIHGKEGEYEDGHHEVRHLWKTQYAGKTADVAFAQFMPVSRGLGWAFVLAAIPLIIYHNILITWSLHLDILSLTDYTQLSITLPERHIVLALATAWLIVFMGVCRGNTWMSWAIRFTATIPYLMLFILLIRGLSLPGASLGLTFLFSSASDDISSLKLWSAAAEQVLFEIGVGVGAVFSISAYSRFRNNVYRDAALLITMFDLSFAILSAITDHDDFQRRLDVHPRQHGPIFLPWITINLIRAGNLYNHKSRPLVHNFHRNPQYDVTNALGSSLDEYIVYDNLLYSSGR